MTRKQRFGVLLISLSLLLFSVQNRSVLNANKEDKMISKQTKRNLRGADLLFLAISTTSSECQTEDSIVRYALQIGARDKPAWTTAELQRKSTGVFKMLIRETNWQRVRHIFSESEKAELRSAFTGTVICPVGSTIDEKKLSAALAEKVKHFLPVRQT